MTFKSPDGGWSVVSILRELKEGVELCKHRKAFLLNAAESGRVSSEDDMRLIDQLLLSSHLCSKSYLGAHPHHR